MARRALSSAGRGSSPVRACASSISVHRVASRFHSDGSLRAPSGPLSHDHPHPRNYGAFTRFLRMALDGETVPLPEAIRKMTSLPAEHFRLRERGLLRPGAFADIAVFDAGRILEKSSYARPHQLSEGLQNLFVNGQAIISDGHLQSARPGRVLD